MKIAFTVNSNSWNSPVNIRFGKSKGFFVIDTENEEKQYISNEIENDNEIEKGKVAVQKLLKEGIQVVITGKVGEKALKILKAAGISIYGGLGYATIQEVYEKYKQGLLISQTP